MRLISLIYFLYSMHRYTSPQLEISLWRSPFGEPHEPHEPHESHEAHVAHIVSIHLGLEQWNPIQIQNSLQMNQILRDYLTFARTNWRLISFQGPSRNSRLISFERPSNELKVNFVRGPRDTQKSSKSDGFYR